MRPSLCSLTNASDTALDRVSSKVKHFILQIERSSAFRHHVKANQKMRELPIRWKFEAVTKSPHETSQEMLRDDDTAYKSAHRTDLSTYTPED